MFERGLAYRRRSSVNWCPKDQTVLANEQVVDGGCWRCGTPVETRDLEQWFFRITAYADELLNATIELKKWPEKVLTMQQNWIGRSEGARVKFPLEEASGSPTQGEGSTDIEVFTTRIDTIYGATFVLLGPEHPLVATLADKTRDPAAFRKQAQTFRTQDRAARISGEIEKQGFDTGFRAINPFTKQPVPIWVANFVLGDYGTGAVMAVPAHDQRDFEFARKFDLPIKIVIVPEDGPAPDAETMQEAADAYGRTADSGEFSNMPSDEAQRRMIAFAKECNIGEGTVQYRLKDWGISRQRYWGTPIPMIYCEKDGIVPVPDDQLPVRLPMVTHFTGRGDSPLAQVPEFVNVTCPRCGGPARRETDTMDTFVDSSWYYMRYADPHNSTAPFERDIVDTWLPVDQYIGGVEHAILHLMYARFFVKALNDLGYLEINEPFARLFTQGMITKDGAKMSKSRGNVVTPKQIIDSHGADTARCYILFIGPPDQDADWSDEGVEGVHRFLARLWRLSAAAAGGAGSGGEQPETTHGFGEEIVRKAHWAIEKVTNDMSGRFAFNTAIAAVMELTNTCSKAVNDQGNPDPQALRFALATANSLLFPFAPHAAADGYNLLTGRRVWEVPWPTADLAYLVSDTIEVVCQVNGKVRDRVEAPTGAAREELEALCLAMPKVQAHIDGKDVVKVVVVPERLVNVVVR
jgi:leucyl-tRNA synthetase